MQPFDKHPADSQADPEDTPPNQKSSALLSRDYKMGPIVEENTSPMIGSAGVNSAALAPGEAAEEREDGPLILPNLQMNDRRRVLSVVENTHGGKKEQILEMVNKYYNKRKIDTASSFK